MFGCYTSDREKFVAGLLYIALQLKKINVLPDFFRIFKIMYFSDINSLRHYYQTIFGDWRALPNGPVPENLYKLIKEVRSGAKNDNFSLQVNNIIPKKEPDMEEFSESDIECMNASIAKYGKFTFDQLKEASHDKAWENTLRGYEMNVLDIAKVSGLNSHVVKYIKERILNCSPANLTGALE